MYDLVGPGAETNPYGFGYTVSGQGMDQMGLYQKQLQDFLGATRKWDDDLAMREHQMPAAQAAYDTALASAQVGHYKQGQELLEAVNRGARASDGGVGVFDVTKSPDGHNIYTMNLQGTMQNMNNVQAWREQQAAQYGAYGTPTQQPYYQQYQQYQDPQYYGGRQSYGW